MATYKQSESNVTLVADTTDAIAIINDTTPFLNSDTAKLMSMRNDGTEVGGISAEGVFFGHAIDISDMAYINVSLDTTAATTRTWSAGQLGTWTDFALTYDTLINKNWAYDDTSKVFTYQGDHAKVSSFTYGLTCERTDTGGTPAMSIVIAKSTDGTNYTNIEDTIAIRAFSGTDTGFMGYGGLIQIDPGDTFKMQVKLDNQAASFDFRNIFFNFQLVDSYPTGLLAP